MWLRDGATSIWEKKAVAAAQTGHATFPQQLPPQNFQHPTWQAMHKNACSYMQIPAAV